MRCPRPAFFGFLACLLTLSPVFAEGWEEIPWLDDAQGYRQALEQAEKTGAPVLVYFYTAWCPYCRQLNESLLADPEVQEQISQMVPVRVNPEAGADERSLASHYKVRGYPALFVYTSTMGGRFQAIRRTVNDPSGVRLKTPEEFVATLRSVR